MCVVKNALQNVWKKQNIVHFHLQIKLCILAQLFGFFPPQWAQKHFVKKYYNLPDWHLTSFSFISSFSWDSSAIASLKLLDGSNFQAGGDMSRSNNLRIWNPTKSKCPKGMWVKKKRKEKKETSQREVFVHTKLKSRVGAHWFEGWSGRLTRTRWDTLSAIRPGGKVTGTMWLQHLKQEVSRNWHHNSSWSTKTKTETKIMITKKKDNDLNVWHPLTHVIKWKN